MTDTKVKTLETLFFTLSTYSKELHAIFGDSFKDYGRDQVRDFIGDLVISAGNRIKSTDFSKESMDKKIKWPEDHTEFEKKLQDVYKFFYKDEPDTENTSTPKKDQETLVELCNLFWKSLTSVQYKQLTEISSTLVERIHLVLSEPNEKILLKNFKDFLNETYPDVGATVLLSQMYVILNETQKLIVQKIFGIIQNTEEN